MMDSDNNALFSLELVVEKLYIPHLTCRFPAVAFRLLDYPTIVIKHVEDDLAAVIRQKVSLESSHQIPQQFHELKDRHGNFMVKKGKSCLFTMMPESLKQYLVSTPLYVMVIDQFPNVPKLLGNATVPLDSLINLVLMDIVKLGPTVPSVHGDKGLYKLCNLMGKEIGYIVLGFRLLCLGPSLIPHLPQHTLAQMSSQKMAVEDRKIEQVLRENKFVEEVENEKENNVVHVRDSFSMTEPMKQDVLLQTVELEEKGVNVNTMTENEGALPKANAIPRTNAVSTQTEKRKLIQESQNANKQWVERNDMKVDDDGIIVNNIICPPPLFYNSEGAPTIQIEKVNSSYNHESEDLSVEDLSDIDSFEGYGLEKKVQRKDQRTKFHDEIQAEKLQSEKQIHEFSQKHHKFIPQARQGEKVQGLPVAPQKESVFPLLSALINELACIQDPQFLLNVSRKIQVAEEKASKLDQIANDKIKTEHKEKVCAPSVVAAVASALTKKIDISQGNFEDEGRNVGGRFDKKDQRKKVNSKEKLTPKERAENAKRKSKLVYGLTNTQRLRLQKVNPTWLKSIEKDAVMKSKRDKKEEVDEYEINAMNFSDTLTEVRRLAEKELDSTAGGDTLRHLASEVEEFESNLEHTNKNRIPLKKTFPSPKRTHVIRPEISQKSPLSARQVNKMGGDHKKQRSLSRSSVRSSAPKSAVRETASKSRHKIHQRRAQQQKEKQDLGYSSDSDEWMIKKKPVPLERHMFGITSPSLDDQGQRMNDYDDGMSARSDLPSSRSRSIEVRLPSADPDMDDNATLSDDENRVMNDSEADDDIPLPDDSIQTEPKVMELNFPRYVSREMSLPESIEGNPNASLNISGDVTQNSPLESTRHSKNMTEEPNESRVLQSTDYDTRQFHSTDEPELQGLMSEEENQTGTEHSAAQSYLSVQTSQKFPVINPQLSENSPVPSVRRSTNKLDAGALSYLPSMSLSKGQMSPTSSRPGTPKMTSPSTPRVTSYRKTIDLESIHKNAQGNMTPRSGQSSPKRQTPRSRRQIIDYKTSIHTDSVSSYMPSDPENVLVSLSSNSGNYSDDFQPLASGESGDGNSSVEQLPKIIPAKKLGYTIS